MRLRSRTLAGTPCSGRGLSLYKGVGTVESLSFCFPGDAGEPRPGRPPGRCRGGVCWARLRPLLPSLCPHSYPRNATSRLASESKVFTDEETLLSFLNLLLSGHTDSVSKNVKPRPEVAGLAPPRGKPLQAPCLLPALPLPTRPPVFKDWRSHLLQEVLPDTPSSWLAEAGAALCPPTALQADLAPPGLLWQLGGPACQQQASAV